MSKRDWKPGDVAVVHITRWPAACEWSDDTSAVLVRVAEDGYMHVVDGDPAAPLCVPPSLIAEYVRPLVVIDPEDREQVERLVTLYYTIIRGEAVAPEPSLPDTMQAALREFANPTPPRPEEPTGLGAVVEDAEGVRWIRVQNDPQASPWLRLNAAAEGISTGYREWDAITAARILSEGVTP